MDRVFWVECPECHGKHYCDWPLRHAGLKCICPYCKKEYLPDEAAWIDDRA